MVAAREPDWLHYMYYAAGALPSRRLSASEGPTALNRDGGRQRGSREAWRAEGHAVFMPAAAAALALDGLGRWGACKV